MAFCFLVIVFFSLLFFLFSFVVFEILFIVFSFVLMVHKYIERKCDDKVFSLTICNSFMLFESEIFYYYAKIAYNKFFCFLCSENMTGKPTTNSNGYSNSTPISQLPPIMENMHILSLWISSNEHRAPST